MSPKRIFFLINHNKKSVFIIFTLFLGLLCIWSLLNRAKFRIVHKRRPILVDESSPASKNNSRMLGRRITGKKGRKQKIDESKQQITPIIMFIKLLITAKINYFWAVYSSLWCVEHFAFIACVCYHGRSWDYVCGF